jgi:hypothetical protein
LLGKGANYPSEAVFKEIGDKASLFSLHRCAMSGSTAPAVSWGREDCATFASQRAIRVGVVGLGGVSEAQIKVYLTLLRRFGELPMSNLSKPGTWKKEKSPFKYFSWFDGSLVLQFVDCMTGPKASEWAEFQAHRRLWAIIGILHVPSCAPGSMAGIEEEFKVRAAPFTIKLQWQLVAHHVNNRW